MTADLPPDVRDRAAEDMIKHLFLLAASDPNGPDAPDYAFYPPEIRQAAKWLVGEMAAVVAPEIKRPLQARLTRAEDDRDKLLEDGLNLITERDALKAQLEQSRRIYAEFVTGQHEEIQTRVQLLTAALDTAIEALGWASDYVSVPWPKAYQVEPLRAALAAGVTESEA